MVNKETLQSIVNNIAEQNVDMACKILLPYIEEEVPTEDDIIAIEEGRKDFLMGETVSHNDINWD